MRHCGPWVWLCGCMAHLDALFDGGFINLGAPLNPDHDILRDHGLDPVFEVDRGLRYQPALNNLLDGERAALNIVRGLANQARVQGLLHVPRVGLLAVLKASAARPDGWRGVMATWIDRVRATFHFACENRDQGSLRSLLIEEMGAWMNMGDDEKPLALERGLRSDGPRTTMARAVAPHATKPMGAGETVLVLGWTPELVECCRAAHRAG